MTNNSVLDKIFEATYHEGLDTTAWRLSSAEVIKDKVKKPAKKAGDETKTKPIPIPKPKSKPSAGVWNTKGRSFDILGNLYADTQTWLLNKTELLKKRALKKATKSDDKNAIVERFERDKTRLQQFIAECTNDKLCQTAGCAFCSGLGQRIGTHAGHNYFTRNNLYNNKENPLVLATFMLDDFDIKGEDAIRFKSTKAKIAFLKSETADILKEINAKLAIGSLDFSWCVDKRTHVPKNELRESHWMPHIHMIMHKNDYAAFRKKMGNVAQQ